MSATESNPASEEAPLYQELPDLETQAGEGEKATSGSQPGKAGSKPRKAATQRAPHAPRAPIYESLVRKRREKALEGMTPEEAQEAKAKWSKRRSSRATVARKVKYYSKVEGYLLPKKNIIDYTRKVIMEIDPDLRVSRDAFLGIQDHVEHELNRYQECARLVTETRGHITTGARDLKTAMEIVHRFAAKRAINPDVVVMQPRKPRSDARAAPSLDHAEEEA